MKTKTSVSLSTNLLRQIDRRAKRIKSNRSEFIECAVSDYLGRLSREELDARDLGIINANVDRLNEEALDTLEYQVPI
ncbi:MAG: ribbon-helix-helix protein, CopG family [Candidatus Sumerlaeaceae bacterium]|nr:ribbon-helix-helix protein, CopG family [Candidatus Sumerlaeaceae bacterium]